MGTRWLAVAAVFVASCATALAADPPSLRGAPFYAPPPAFTWTGFSIGIVGGGALGSAEQTDSTPWSSGTYRVGGGLVGASLGYNWQVNNFVFGLEGDGSAAWVRGSTLGIPPAFPACFLPDCAANLAALGTGRARLGFAVDRFLPYVTGGGAVGALHGQEGVGSGGTRAVVGWTVGAGIEAKLSQDWSAKLEYLHLDLGNRVLFDEDIPPVFAERVRFSSEIVRVGLNYQFDLFEPPAAIAAKY
jgi:outer membrane immunogenic protein